ncbi:hypothetical protein C2G38_1607584 [Gigaspora rosea]|uniref:Uncharacterized protein n=1 Tax=Gigaspora rosea TaxID=44941 RepID=A0A397V6Y6_9GLOM|nr:hypothetical protein C2G38_1607584 [Gigaspora rosea]
MSGVLNRLIETKLGKIHLRIQLFFLFNINFILIIIGTSGEHRFQISSNGSSGSSVIAPSSSVSFLLFFFRLLILSLGVTFSPFSGFFLSCISFPRPVFNEELRASFFFLFAFVCVHVTLHSVSRSNSRSGPIQKMFHFFLMIHRTTFHRCRLAHYLQR